jgi:uncharacterized BrkB/YihY/UPF0761 family membrane protein
MIEFEKDPKLERLIKETRLEKPGRNFTMKVMNEIYALEPTRSVQSGFPVLGRTFWVLGSLFVVLAILFIVLSGTIADTGGTLNNFLSVDTGNITREYRNILGQIGNIPLSIAAILTATSILLIIERFMAKKHLFV